MATAAGLSPLAQAALFRNLASAAESGAALCGTLGLLNPALLTSQSKTQMRESRIEMSEAGSVEAPSCVLTTPSRGHEADHVAH